MRSVIMSLPRLNLYIDRRDFEMKKTYNTPRVEISYFETENVVTTSSKTDSQNALEAQGISKTNITVQDVKLVF